ncbi:MULTISPECIES: YcxB family protein [unclassified Arcicella]|uniref:YcxB family protein n=1 Tax=unclassified Arcicella TaxID=2644986 RepID=UPI00285AEBB9|nr:MULTISPECIES: YcxB family protein [unclassified Arcicella]MDR6562862.1 hypothetical protein [Arcicella sp. BE51]MDR6812797.1 hypothetical protein [Arcicella sp. BE140]MDR6824109.1 hypothetical protein [Arcicella sp. BE139]
MTIDYKIDEKDFLIHQLYLASKSDRIRKKRQRNKVIVPTIYLILGLLLFLGDKFLLAIIFVILGVLWYFIYPIWEKRHYINHYTSFIKENLSDRLDRITTLEFNNDYILAKQNGSESKILTIELEEICEIPTIILVRLKSGLFYILPKDKISNIDNLTVRLKELADYLRIKYSIDEKWEWK